MPAVVTVYAKRPELRVVEADLRVLPVVRREPDHVMNMRRRSELTAEQTVLAERMQLQIGLTARLPRRAVIKGSWSRPCHWSQPPPYKASAAGQAAARKKLGVSPSSLQRPL